MQPEPRASTLFGPAWLHWVARTTYRSSPAFGQFAANLASKLQPPFFGSLPLYAH